MKFTLPILLLCLLMGNIVLNAQNYTGDNGERVTTAQVEIPVHDHTSPILNKWDYFIYPVPAVDEINIKVTRGHAIIQQVTIVDEFGNDVLEIKELSTEKMKVNISDLPAGKYYLQVRPDLEGPVKMKRFYISN